MIKISKEELDKILKDNRLWVSDNNKGHKAVLKDIDFSSMELEMCDFSYADIINCNFNRCNLRYASFDNCSLENVKFEYSILEESTFICVKANKVNFFRATLFRSRFNESKITNSDFGYSDSGLINFKGSYIENASFEFSNLSHTNFISCKLNKVKLEDCKCIYANFSDSVINECDLRYSDMRYTVFNDTALIRSKLQGTSLYGANLLSTKMENNSIDTRTQGLFSACPEEGEYIAYWYCYDKLIKLLIPYDSERVSGIMGRCIAKKAKVLDIVDMAGNHFEKAFSSIYDTVYVKGEVIDNFSKDGIEWCVDNYSKGVKHYISRLEAEVAIEQYM